MNLLYTALSVLAGIASLQSGHPRGLPVLGLAFGAAAVLRESRGSRRLLVLLVAGLGCLASGLGTIGSLVAVYR